MLTSIYTSRRRTRWRSSIRRLVTGGILLCDDYGYHTCPGARKAFDEFAATTPEQSVVHLPTGQGFIVKRARPSAEG